MARLFTDSNGDRLGQRTEILTQRMIKLHQAVVEHRITVEQLHEVAELSTTEVEVKSTQLREGTLDATLLDKAAFQDLYRILIDPSPITIADDRQLIEGLKQFDEAHGDYLSLESLSVDNHETLALNLNDFALAYDVFIQHLTCKKTRDELKDNYAVSVNLPAAKLRWIDWETTRPSRVTYDQNQAGFPGLLEKFLAGRLKKDEWLTDLDINRAFKILGLTEKGAHVVPFKTDDIGLVLHFEREKHRLDDPPMPYTIPLVVNLGEDDHSRIDSRGNHWTRLLVTVDPREVPPKITAKYTDELQLPEPKKRKLRETITAALKYREQQGDITSSNLKVYSAFPDCVKPQIEIIGSGEQRDGFTCGYRALRGLINDLSESGSLTIKDNQLHGQFIACHDSISFRDFGYRLLIGKQPLARHEREQITHSSQWTTTSFEPKNQQSFIKPSLIDGQLLELAQPSTARTMKGSSKALTVEQLEALVEKNKILSRLNELDIVKNFSSSTDESVTLNVSELLNASEIKACEDDELALQAIITAISRNQNTKKITLNGVDLLDPRRLESLYGQLDPLSLRVKLTTADSSPLFKDHLERINARNNLLTRLSAQPSEQISDPWSRLFELMLFTPPEKPSKGVFKFVNLDDGTRFNEMGQLGAVGFAKILQYMADNEERFLNGQLLYQTLSIADLRFVTNKKGQKSSSDEVLQALKAHLSSSSPFVPFKHLILGVIDRTEITEAEQDTLLNELKEILTLLQQSNIEQLELRSTLSPPLETQHIDQLIQFVKENKIKSLVTFSVEELVIEDANIARKLAELENAILANRRSAQIPLVLDTEHKPHEAIILGKIGKAILGLGGVGSLDTEVQVQQQQQQQVQQQVQTAINDEALPDEDEIEAEIFSSYASSEELLDRTQFIEYMTDFVRNRHPHLEPGQCWDLITGANAELFKYGINKMTVSAAKVLVDNLQDVQYGLHPDNLPQGFSLEQDEQKKVVLTYTQFNPTINPKESPLTIRFSKPQPHNKWAGNALQFINEDQATTLYQELFPKKKVQKPSLDECISQCFFLNDATNTHNLTSANYRQILQAFIAGQAQGNLDKAKKINKQIKLLFGDDTSEKMMAALSEILYEQGPDVLSDFLASLQQIKEIRGEQFFKMFKTVFITPSNNLNELTTEASRAAIQKLLTFSPAQAVWWQSLTEQHSSNLKYAEVSSEPAGEFIVVGAAEPGKRWSNLAELTEAFVHFCGQLDEVHPGLTLTEYCPLRNVADMRVGLDRLVSTILPNAHDINEQFYESLNSLSLDPLGPFYASRYEGFKLVSSEMELVLGCMSDKAKNDRRDYAENGFCFRCDKDKVKGNLQQSETNSQKKANFLRYIATFNQRAAAKNYSNAFQKINDNVPSKDESAINYALIIVAIFGTGKRGKLFTSEDIDTLVNFINKTNNDLDRKQHIKNIINQWAALRTYPIRPTIAQIIAISELALTTSNDPTNRILEVYDFVTLFKDAADGYIETLSLLTQNKSGISFDTLHLMLMQTEGVNALEKSKRRINAQPEFLFEGALHADSLRAATAKLFAVCSKEGVTDKNAVSKAQLLYRSVTACFNKHGEQTTSDLLELLGSIDVNSALLPTLDALTEIVTSVLSDNKPNYNALEAAIKRQLPAECTIQTSQVTAAPVESGGNLLTIITKYMSEIRGELLPQKVMIDRKLGEGFFNSLSTQEGPSLLLSKLKDIADLTGFIGTVAQSQIQGVMTNVYETVLGDGITRVGVRDEQSRQVLSKVINKKLTHPVKKPGDFKQFVLIYPGEISAIEQLFANLQKINKTWPNSFGSVIETLDSCTNLGTYSIDVLAKITSVVAKTKHVDPSKFPIETFKAFFDFKILDAKTLGSISVIIKTLFDESDEAEPIPRSDRETQLLCQLALRYCKQNPDNDVNTFTKALLAVQNNNPKWFTRKLELLSACVDLKQGLDNVKEAFAQLEQLDDAKLNTLILDFFVDEQSGDFLRLMTDENIVDLPKDKKSFVLTIALKAAQKLTEKSEDDFTQIMKAILKAITRLSPLDKETLPKLAELYNTPRHPNLTDLNVILSQSALNLDELAASYDRDPFSERKNPAVLKAQFDTDSLANYLDNLRDLNYDRPLLLSQRQELQTWFLYVNTIGKDRPILTRPGQPDISDSKSINLMSHSEIQGLLEYYRALFKKPETTPEQRIKAQLECIAILREVMFRGTGLFPRPTQTLYLLTAMQQGKDFIAQVQTGEGKSMTAALAAAMANLQGQTVDVCTSSSSLASEGVHENQGFFDYLGTPVQLIHAGSTRTEYQEGAIHYSTMSDMALYRSKMQLMGKVFPKDCALIADEVDFSTLDDNTRYRFATSLDPVSDPYKSPYTWIYEALVQFVDAKKAKDTKMTDVDLLAEAKVWLKNSAKSKEQRAQLNDLEGTQKVYHKRLETWLVAAAKTAQLVEQEQTKFRVVQLEHPKYGKIAKACILAGGRPSIQAEFSNAIQQFLHVRLRTKYQDKIADGTLPDFLVEPEKTYVTTLNSKILMDTYNVRLGMSGTAGSPSEIKEQYAKYGFRFVDIPPFKDSKRTDLQPILTNPKFLNNPAREEEDHIKKIVQDTLRHIRDQKRGSCSPVLIHCADEIQGRKICHELDKAIRANPKPYQGKFKGIDEGIQQYYSSEKLTAQLRNKEENEYKTKAGEHGMITISTVFDRGTDIKPTHERGLYTVQTSVDTEPYSVEDLERSKRQKIGRAGRAGQIGFTRLIVCRSQFADCYDVKQLRNIPQTVEAVDDAIRALNTVRNKPRVTDRMLRESFDDVKEIVFQQFNQFIQLVNKNTKDAPDAGQAIRTQLLQHWNLLLGCIDDHWEQLQHDGGSHNENLNAIAEFACREWNELAKAGGILKTELTNWAKRHELTISLPPMQELTPEKVIKQVTARYPMLQRHYIKDTQLRSRVDPTASADAAYCNCIAMDTKDRRDRLQATVDAAKTKVMGELLQRHSEYLSTQARRSQLHGKFNLQNAHDNPGKVEQIMGALLYLRYKAFRDGNSLAHAALGKNCREFVKKITWSGDTDLIKALTKAQQAHFVALTNHQGKFEEQKSRYLNLMMSEWRKDLPQQTDEWKRDANTFATWWNGPKGHVRSDEAMKTQAVKWLTNYQGKWWGVSRDRKNVANKLLQKLEQDNASPEHILVYISLARNQLLADDAKHKRSVADGTQGRLYQFLNDLETRLLAASPAATLDDDVKRKFSDIQIVLERFRNLPQFKDLNSALTKVISAIQVHNASVQDQYRVISAFFRNMELMAYNDKRFEQGDGCSLLTYCQQQQVQLVSYFAQCDKYSAINQKGSAPVYRAASAAVFNVIQNVLITEPQSKKLELPADKMAYRDYQVNFENQSPIIDNKKYSLFRKFNTTERYKELLFAIEKSIVERSPGDTRVKFVSITLDNSTHFQPDPAFSLNVAMTINGQYTSVKYDINLKTGVIYCDNASLTNLDNSHEKEPHLGDVSPRARAQTILEQWKNLQKMGGLLKDDTKQVITLYQAQLDDLLAQKQQKWPESSLTSLEEYKKAFKKLEDEDPETEKDNAPN